MNRSKLLKEFKFKEEFIEVNYGGQFDFTGYPVPTKSYKISYEKHDLSLEEAYYWVLEDLQQKFTIIEKLEDSFSASENSAFFGVTQQRLGAQQDKVSQFLATTGKMIKELFQMVRELRILDERLGYYEESASQLDLPMDQRIKSAEVTLRGLFVDLVQGGGKSAASIYGMARELEFITLPDLFFDAPPFKDPAEMEQYVQSLEKDFNQNVLRVIRRHFRQFMQWKAATHQEHKNRKRFMQQYLWQHYEIVQMYINWVKPYLRHVSRLHMKDSNASSADLISAFDGNLIDIEVMARKRKDVMGTGVNGVVLATFNYRTRPEMKVVSEGYQRGPVQVGKLTMHLRTYKWTDDEVERYKKLKEKESWELMGEISGSVQKAMEALGDELEKYLRLAKEEKAAEKSQEEKTPMKKTMFERMFGDFYNSKPKLDTGPRKSRKQMVIEQEAIKGALKGLDQYTRAMTFLTFKNFKKSHRMVMW